MKQKILLLSIAFHFFNLTSGDNKKSKQYQKSTIKYITGDDLEIFKLIFNNKTVCIFVFKQFKNGFNLMFNFYVDIVFIYFFLEFHLFV